MPMVYRVCIGRDRFVFGDAQSREAFVQGWLHALYGHDLLEHQQARALMGFFEGPVIHFSVVENPNQSYDHDAAGGDVRPATRIPRG